MKATGLLVLGRLLLLATSAVFCAVTSAEDGEAVFAARCATCHLNPQDNTHAPSKADMVQFTPNVIYAALKDGAMRLQAAALSDGERRAVAEWLTGKNVADVKLEMTAHLCRNNPALRPDAADRQWNGWGNDLHNTRSAARSAITASTISRLKLKWAYGLPGEAQVRGQPAIFGGRLFVGSRAGALYSVDADSGCTYWTFLPRAGVRSASTVAQVKLPNGKNGYAVYFVDAMANVYAVNAEDGKLLWQQRVDSHSAVRGTGSLTVYKGRVYVPVTGVNEENAAGSPDYACCTFRGNLTALDARTGKQLWKYYTVGEPKPRGTSASGKPLYGPAGVGIWSAPTIDEKRKLLYTATGNAYADPAPPTADAVLAIDLEKGTLVWSKQLTQPGDAFVGGCSKESAANCPKEIGPDFDFSASPVLTEVAGRQMLVIPQKSGMVYALDPARRGEVLWQYRAGVGSAVGGVWGAAVLQGQVFVAVGGYRTATTGGVHGIDLQSGQRQWFTPPQPLLCKQGNGCGATQSAALTAVPGVVFSGSQDGGLRAYDTSTGAVVWTFDANRDFDTVNKVAANGASFDGPGPVIAADRLYVLSGNAGFVGRPGNVLLAFELSPH